MINNDTPQIAIIVALDEKNGIGRKGGLLCHLPNDLKHFKELTTGHTIIMGRKTYESLPKEIGRASCRERVYPRV